MKRLIAIALAAGLSACVTATITETFDPQAGAYVHKKGSGRIEGSAFLRQRGGGVVTAAGSTASLVPVTTYSKARFAALYRDRKINDGLVRLETTPPEYLAQQRNVKVDVDGKFQFGEVFAGDYFITTTVTWTAGGALQGGHIYEKVSVKPGEIVKVVMSGE